MALAQTLVLFMLATCSFANNDYEFKKHALSKYIHIELFPDPTEIGDLSFEFNEKLITGNFSFSNLIVTGSDSMDIEIDDKNFHGSVALQVAGGYMSNGILLTLIPIAGNGDLSIKGDITFEGFFEFSGITLKEFKMYIDIEPEVKITGLIGDEYMSELIGRQISAIIKDISVDFREEISELISCIVLGTDIQTCLKNFLPILYKNL